MKIGNFYSKASKLSLKRREFMNIGIHLVVVKWILLVTRNIIDHVITYKICF